MAEENKVVNEQVKEARNDAPRGKKPFNKNGRRPVRERKVDEFEDRTVAVNKVCKNVNRVKRHQRIRKQISGTPECPRL